MEPHSDAMAGVNEWPGWAGLFSLGLALYAVSNGRPALAVGGSPDHGICSAGSNEYGELSDGYDP